jgi:hypothetical protein
MRIVMLLLMISACAAKTPGADHPSETASDPFYCHTVAAPNGATTALCSRSVDECVAWRDKNSRAGFVTTDDCTPRRDAACFLDRDSREFCAATLAECAEFRQNVPAAGTGPCAMARTD